MGFQDIKEQLHVQTLLQKALITQQISHAYLFAGPVGSGRKEMARMFAQALLCEQQTNNSCGECLACRKIQHGNHSDLHFIEPDGNSIKIQQIQQMQHDFSYRKIGTGYKIYLIAEAEKMTLQAANRLLKFLEEPPSLIVAILITEGIQKISPTLRSRCQIILFKEIDRRALENFLKQQGHPFLLARTVANLGYGKEDCQQLLEKEWFADLRKVVVQLGKKDPSKFTQLLLEAQKTIFKTRLNDHIDILMKLFVLWYRDIIYALIGHQEQMIFSDEMQWITRLSHSRPLTSWVNVLESALKTERRIKSHVVPQLVLEQFLISVREG